MKDNGVQSLALTRAQSALPDASEFDVMQRISRMFQESGLYKNVANVAQAIAIVQTGRELGIGPSMALREMYIIPGQGRPTLSAALLGALVQRDHGDDAIRVMENTNDACRVLYKRRLWDRAHEITFTMEDARRAELVKPKSNWEKFPRAMLRSRAISEACRAGFQDSILGLYSVEELAPDVVTVTSDGDVVAAVTPEELGAEVDSIDGEEVVHAPAVQASAARALPPSSSATPTQPLANGIEALRAEVMQLALARLDLDVAKVGWKALATRVHDTINAFLTVPASKEAIDGAWLTQVRDILAAYRSPEPDGAGATTEDADPMGAFDNPLVPAFDDASVEV